MGIAVVVPSISFASKNLGKVTASGGHVEALSIGGPDSINVAGNKANFYVYFTPASTPERGVVWSIESGSQYASINSATGQVSVLPGASFSPVTIKVTSTEDASIFATKDIAVNYSYIMEYVASKANAGIPYITTLNPNPAYKYDMVFMLEDAIDQDIFGTRVSSSSNQLRFFGETSTSKFRGVKYVSGSSIQYDLNHTIQTGKKYRIVMSNVNTNGLHLYEVNGSVETLLDEGGNMSAQVTSSVPLMLCAMNNNGTPVAYKNAKLRIYSFRIFTNDGNVLVLKPYYDAQNSRPALYDELTGTIYPYHSTGTATLFYKQIGETEQSVAINS